MYICVVIEVSVPRQERELSCISVLLLKCMYQASKDSYHVYLCFIEVSVPSHDSELLCISVLLLRCLNQGRRESYHVNLCCY